jgi:hypothetical protein
MSQGKMGSMLSDIGIKLTHWVTALSPWQVKLSGVRVK